MLLHYFTIAWRNLWKNRVFSLINVFGLAVGLACCLLMTLYVRHELRYDQFQKKGDRIARVIMEYGFSGSVNKGNYTSTKVAPTFQRTFPEIESAVRMTQLPRVVRHEDKLFNEKKFMYADSSFFNVFEFRMLRGSPQRALNGPNMVVLTAAAATKYFGKEDPVGKILKVGANGEDYLVTGVMENYPSNSQMQFDFLASFSSLGVNQEETYWDANYTTYFLLRDKAALAGLQAKIPGFMKKEMGTEASINDYLTFWLEPFTRIHLHSPYAGFEPTNSSTYVTMVGAVALLVLLLSALVFARRMRPESRRLRVAEILLSVLVAAAGAAATLLMLVFMASGVTYRGDSPDAAGMSIVFGLFLYFPSAGLLILPLAMKVSRLSPRLRRGLGWSVFLLVLLPFAVLTVASLSVAS